jgi:imidazoleglycerol-phosphate dehydratase
MDQRIGVVTRETGETSVTAEMVIDGSGKADITTGMRMFDHLLSQVARHGLFDLRVSATGADPHHVVEDTSICMGRAFNQALGERSGLTRMAHAVIPMDDALALVAIDIGGRGYAAVEASFDTDTIAELPADLVRHFLESFAAEARINLHAKVLAGINEHHKAEALFKALGRALDAAARVDDRITGEIPSTKGVIDTGR